MILFFSSTDCSLPILTNREWKINKTAWSGAKGILKPNTYKIILLNLNHGLTIFTTKQSGYIQVCYRQDCTALDSM